MVEKVTTALSLMAGVSGLVLAWRSYRYKAQSAYVDDLNTVRLALKEENERLAKKVDQLQARLEEAEQRILELQYERECLVERLNLERETFAKRIAALEKELERLQQLATNTE